MGSPNGVGEGHGAGIGSGIGPGIGGNTGPADPANRVYRRSDVTQKARIISKPQPEYPYAANEHCVWGTIRISAVLRSDGTVTNIRPINQLPDGLTDAAIRAARRIQLEPALKDGKAVSQYVTVEYNFSIFLDEGDRDLKTPVVITDRPEPVYNDLARQHRTRGKVVLKLMLNPDGRVEIIKTEHGLGDGLTEAAIEAAKKIKFTPAVSGGGCVVAQTYRIEYSFEP